MERKTDKIEMIQVIDIYDIDLTDEERRSIFVELEVQGNDSYQRINFNYTIEEEEEDSPIIKTLYKKLEELGVDMRVCTVKDMVVK